MVYDTPLLLGASTAIGTAILLIGLALAFAWRPVASTRLRSVLDADRAAWGPARGPGSETDAAHEGLRAILAKFDSGIAATRFGRGLRVLIAAAGLDFPVTAFLFLCLVSTVVGAAIALALESQLAVVGGLFGLYLPWWYIRAKRGRRQAAFSLQLADTVLALSSSLRAGLSLPQALERVSAEAVEPTRGELQRVVRETRMGLSTNAALRGMSARMSSRDLDLLVIALDVQREVGGDVVELMESMSDLMRERHGIKSEVRVITSQQRLAAQIMFSMPVGIGALLFLLNPQYMMQLFSSERLLCGLPVFLMPATAGTLLLIGYAAVRSAGKVDV